MNDPDRSPAGRFIVVCPDCSKPLLILATLDDELICESNNCDRIGVHPNEAVCRWEPAE